MPPFPLSPKILRYNNVGDLIRNPPPRWTTLHQLAYSRVLRLMSPYYYYTTWTPLFLLTLFPHQWAGVKAAVSFLTGSLHIQQPVGKSKTQKQQVNALLQAWKKWLYNLTSIYTHEFSCRPSAHPCWNLMFAPPLHHVTLYVWPAEN